MRLQSLAPAHKLVARTPHSIASDDSVQPIRLRYVLQSFAPKAAEMRAPMKWPPAITSPLLGTWIQRTPLIFYRQSFVAHRYRSAVKSMWVLLRIRINIHH